MLGCIVVSEDGKNLVLRGGVTQLAARHVPTEDLLIRNLVRLIRQRISFYGSWVTVLKDECPRPNCALPKSVDNLAHLLRMEKIPFFHLLTFRRVLLECILLSLLFCRIFFLQNAYCNVGVPLWLKRHILSWLFYLQQIWLLPSLWSSFLLG